MNNPLTRNNVYAMTAFFAVLIGIVYSPVLFGNFISYDDPAYVTGNDYVKAGLTFQGAAWAFTTFHSYNWHPVTWLSHMLDASLFGLNPAGHHLTSLVFHVANSLLLFGVFRKMTGATWRSLCVAALFALHPLHVESVAWIAERKDVLSTFFWLLTIRAYVGYAKSPRLAGYLAVVLFFALGLMSKPMLVTLPFVLLLLDYWPLGRFRPLPGDAGSSAAADCPPPARLFLEKAPLLALAIASSIVTYLAQEKGGALAYAASFGDRLGNALISYLGYMEKMLWPSGLAPFYPFNPGAISPLKAAAAALLLVAVSVMAVRGAGRRPYLVTGWFWYLGTLVPVIGFLKIGQHAMADRYTYVPLIGLFIMIAWGAGDLAARWRRGRGALAAAAACCLIVLSVLTWRQAGYWHDSITLFSHALAVTDNNWVAHNNLAKAYADQGRLPEALLHVSASLRIKPDPLQYVSQGWLYSRVGEYALSLDSCRKALAVLPDEPRAHFIMGMDYVFLKDYPSAMAEYSLLQRSNEGFAADLLENITRSGIAPVPAGEKR
jgi:tetratricopeptide (TPR) repeat protein